MNSGLKPRRPRSNRAAVIVLDVLSDFRFADGPAVRKALIARCRAVVRLLHYARERRVPVVYVNDNTGRWRSDLVILKPRHSAFFATPLEILLQQLAVSHLVLAGASIESCVWMTACDAHIRGSGSSRLRFSNGRIL